MNRLDNGYLLWMSLIFLMSGLSPALCVPYLMRKRPSPQPQLPSQREV